MISWVICSLRSMSGRRTLPSASASGWSGWGTTRPSPLPDAAPGGAREAAVPAGAGRRVVGLVHAPALAAAERGAGDAHAALAGAVVHGLGDDHALLERLAVGRADGVDVGDVVRDGVHPPAVDGERGPGDVEAVEHVMPS